jgi:SAM-dependent methyltransferase
MPSGIFLLRAGVLAAALLWRFFQAAVEAQFQDARCLRFLDIGGGAGYFAVRVRDAYPHWNVHVSDISDLLLGYSKSKGFTVVKSSILDDVSDRWMGAFDVVSVNWVLHHLVGPDHSQTNTNAIRALSNIRKLVAPTGLVSVFEDNYVGHFFDDSPGRLIYELTSRRSIARFVRWLGANTAGVGIRFRSVSAWRRIFQSAGLIVRSVSFDSDLRIGRGKKMLLNIKEANCCHFSLSLSGAGS